MATLTELRGLFHDSDLMEKVEAATIIAAFDLISGTPTSADQDWAAAAFSFPRREARKAMMAVLAANADATVVQIQTATDSAIQANVDSVVPTLVVAHGVV